MKAKFSSGLRHTKNRRKGPRPRRLRDSVHVDFVKCRFPSHTTDKKKRAAREGRAKRVAAKNFLRHSHLSEWPPALSAFVTADLYLYTASKESKQRPHYAAKAHVIPAMWQSKVGPKETKIDWKRSYVIILKV